MTNKLKRRGFSLIEIIIVVTIIASIAALVMPRILGQGDRANEKLTESTLSTIAGNIVTYKLNTGKLPTSLNDFVQDPGIKGWRQMAEEVPMDSWNNEITLEQANNMRGYILRSSGANSIMGDQDDIIFPAAK